MKRVELVDARRKIANNPEPRSKLSTNEEKHFFTEKKKTKHKWAKPCLWQGKKEGMNYDFDLITLTTYTIEVDAATVPYLFKQQHVFIFAYMYLYLYIVELHFLLI